jgi:hypothetical protein
LHDIPWHAFLFVYGGLGTVTAAGVLGIRNGTSRTNNLLRAVASKPGAELSSTAPEITPAKDRLRGISPFPAPPSSDSAERHVARHHLDSSDSSRLGGFSVVHTLFSPANRVGKFSGPGFYILEVFLAIGLWFLLPLHFKTEPRIALLVDGEIATGKSLPVPRLRQGVEVAFEFCDAAGNLVRTQRANHTGFPPEGTYMPIFCDAQNPSNCVPACALNYELVLPESMAATHHLGRSKGLRPSRHR